ncbi:MAG: bifunctional diaminohydroxyphosphoribosylaminopyrimidine deaminase/5-amino-6-(5-phosphoribosylamino)uracil reductase RibD [Acidobacteria bacterium]|nr:bifunctional diaminohydroxyphosphoribosylaminopyrimidine deaminase/5-amino-6-(5-phosphoribosylamino)uracil reductase RibD [Acidobacteriota bacterium]MBI3664062.1 bifunctional diaminohydroxyphosphoribosylaminopyrimidine deaminase/5-amino-6-(5-phosphoribosylamino)uracil reductase RibD [Acidobacteriota bacterium]
MDDHRWMARALELARRGEAQTHPNPMVGCVVVRGGRAVGEGFHLYEKRDHAEIVALRRAGERARGATLYVNLEPCCHTGRTGPCTEAILNAGVKRVVAAMRDPNPEVAGRGIARLRRAGVRVDVGVREKEAQKLNEAFAKWMRTGRPFVTLKIAMTLDFKIAGPKKRRRSVTWITSQTSREEVQKMRHAADALLTGIGTVLADDPRLTDRTGLPRRRPLVRVVLDSRLRLPLKSKLVRSAQGDVLVFTTASIRSARARALSRAGVEIMRVREKSGRPELGAVIEELGRREMLSLLVEPGAELYRQTFDADVVDKFVFFVAHKVMGIGLGVSSPMVQWKGRSKLHDVTVRRCGPDFVLEGYLSNVYGNR